MAHGLFNKLTGGSSGASCGFRASELNPHAVAVMAEIGIDISEHTSNAIAEYDPSAFDAIICVCGCAAEVPDEWKAGHFEDWSLDDPPELDPGDRSVYRRVRDELKERIEALAKRLHVAGCGLGLGPLRGGQAAAAGGVRDEVKEYYGKVLQKSADLQTNACCTAVELPQEVKAAIGKVHPEVMSKYYGCGLCVPEALSGLSVLDLGCGSGRDCYVLAQLVGESGSVVGVDMTDEQLSTARQHVAWHADAFGYARPNTDFKQGYIEDLQGIGLRDETFDVVVSNCVVNLSPDKAAVLREAFRVLKAGGEMYFSDVYADRRVPPELRDDPLLYGECLGGALYWNDFLALAKAAGFADPRLVEDAPITVANPALEEKLRGIRFYSATYRLFKLPGRLEADCEDYGQAVVYKGTLPGRAAAFDLDSHHHIEARPHHPQRGDVLPFARPRSLQAGKVFPVCGNTYHMLASTRFRQHFEYVGAHPHEAGKSAHFGIFDGCGKSLPFASASAAGAGGQGSCC